MLVLDCGKVCPQDMKKMSVKIKMCVKIKTGVKTHIIWIV